MEHMEEFDTVVGQDVVLTGSLKNSGSILINGRVQGDVISNQAVVVGAEAMVEGPVTGENVQVSGTVHGSINAANTLELLPNSKVKGDIKAGTLHIHPGAAFNGTSAMDLDLEEETAPSDEANGRTRPKLMLAEDDLEEETAPVEDEEDDTDELPSKIRRKPKLELEG